MELLHYPDPILRVRAETIVDFDASLKALAEDMIATLREITGLGLAAPQVGVSRRIVLVAPDAEPGHEIVLVNPEITRSDGWEESEEGCLSFPGIFVRIGRCTRVAVRYHDLTGKVHEMEAEDLLARAVQHELDHLDGRLLVDRMSTIQRVSQRRRLRELEDRFEQRKNQAGAKAAR
jgi:peptide deformylase